MTAKSDETPAAEKYIATDTILINGWPGYAEGHPVPADVVKNHPEETKDKVKKA